MTKAEIREKGLKTFKTKKVKIDDIEINYAEAGKGKCVVLVHGWTNNWIGMIPLGLELYKNYRVIIPDLPGYGDSGRLENYSFEIQADYLKKFLEKIKVKKPVIAAHSMGAYIISKLYSKYPVFADKLVLIGAMFNKNNKTKGLKIQNLIFKIAREFEIGQSLIKKIIDTDTYSMITSKLINMYEFNRDNVIVFGKEGKLKMSKKVYVDMGYDISKTNVDELISNNLIPIQLIFGDHDKLTNVEHARNILANKGNYQFDTVEKAGHVVTVEKPKELALKMIKFIG
ncbi:MAG TPA: alpha/beta hydrolase [Candidatus Woesebacteria bacterium]|nr:alpha/beta hydrolase [Candidatus Woesebacteria bacterium]